MNPPALSVVASGPKWSDSYQDTWHLTNQVHQYRHSIEAVGGYWSAQFTIRGGRNLADDWMQDGLGRHIEVFDDTLTKCWEGFVDKITVNYGPLSAVRGPLMDIANRVAVTYSAITYDADENPVVGTRLTTAYTDSASSQALWGIIPKILSIGGAEQAEALAIRNSYRSQHRLPRTDKEISSDAHQETSITVDCAGYVHWLNWPYNTTSTGTENASTKIANVLADSPNAAWLDFDVSHVDANTLQVPAWEDEDNLAWSVIKDVTARGDATYARWLFGIYNDLEAYYQAAPTTVYYQQRLSQPRPRIEIIEGDEVYPWKVKPGKWLIFPDFLIGQSTELDLRDDPRAMFIETVRYIAPWEVQLRGGSVDKVDTLVAQLGLSGIGG